MNWDAISAIGENVGALAVVISVLYLAYQVKQNTRHSQAFTQRDIIRDIHGHQAQIRENPRLIRYGFSAFDEMTDDDKLVVNTYFNELVSTFESTLRLNNAGLVDPTVFSGHRGFLLAALQTPGGRQWWIGIKGLFSADIRSYIETEIEREINLPPPLTELISYYGTGDGD